MTAAPTPTHHGGGTRSALSAFFLMVAVLAILVVYLLVHYDVFGSSTSSATVGSGIAASQTRSVGPFAGVELAGSNIVTIRLGRPQSVVVHADDNLLDRVTTAVRGGRLVVGETPGSFTTRAPMSVTVVTPSLDALVLSGSGIVDVTGLESPRLTVELPGSGTLSAQGSVTRLDVTISGSGSAQLRQLTARDATAVVSGSGLIALTATNSLDARVSGSGAISYGGDPGQLQTSVTGSGAITPQP